jgi:hypothetical protein
MYDQDLNNCGEMKKQVAKLRGEFKQRKGSSSLRDRAYAKVNSPSPLMKELHATIQSMVSKGAMKHKSKKHKASKEVHFAESDSDSENSTEELNEFNELNL